jgi:hypothetical protein
MRMFIDYCPWPARVIRCDPKWRSLTIVRLPKERTLRMYEPSGASAASEFEAVEFEPTFYLYPVEDRWLRAGYAWDAESRTVAVWRISN